MSKTWLVLLIGGVVVATILLMVAAVAAFVFLPQIQDWLAGEPQGPVLVYEVDPTTWPSEQRVDMDKLVQAVNRRLNQGRQRLARVRKLDDQQIEVALREKSEDGKRRVEALLAGGGNLEFRILANTRDNKDLIKQALAAPSKARIHDKTGNLLARWVHVKAGQESSMAAYPEIAMRKRMKAGSETTEVLVLNDEYNVTAAYLTRADAGVDSQGRPCITFAFDALGGQLFGELTGDHLPDQLTGFSYKVAIILDDQVYSAPSIRSTIHEGGQITGSFTDDEVQYLSDLLSAGSLPAKIRPVKK